MIILGIDPGTASTGYGVIEQDRQAVKKTFKCLEFGVIKTLPTTLKEYRLKELHLSLKKIITKYNPEILVIEKIFFFRNLKTAIPVSQASGVILFTAAAKKIPIFEFTPLQVKLAITGFGWSEKKIIQAKMKNVLKLKEIPKPDDAADALAIAIAYCLYLDKPVQKKK